MWIEKGFLYLVCLLAFLVSVRAYDVPEIIRTLELEEVAFENLPAPEEQILRLSEEEFQDYFEYWMHLKRQSTTDLPHSRDQCFIALHSFNPFQPQPVYISNGSLLTTNGHGYLVFSYGGAVTVACPGSFLVHPSATLMKTEAVLLCAGGRLFSSPSWLPFPADFNSVTCLTEPSATEMEVGACDGGDYAVRVGLHVSGTLHQLYLSCFQRQVAQPSYVMYKQEPENSDFMIRVPRPSFNQDQRFFTGLDMNRLFSRGSQLAAFDYILGSNHYISDSNFINRGHLAAKTDFSLAPGQRATFSFLNVAPQWENFNGGNWNTLEQDLKRRIGQIGARTKIYTGTLGTLRLWDHHSVLRDMYLYPESKKVPIPLWFYKLVYDRANNKSVVFLGLNNPYVTAEQAQELVPCSDVCANNPAFRWLTWEPRNMRLGYSICCQVANFRRAVPHLPDFGASELFT